MQDAYMDYSEQIFVEKPLKYCTAYPFFEKLQFFWVKPIQEFILENIFLFQQGKFPIFWQII